MGQIIVGNTKDFFKEKIKKVTIDGKDILLANIDGSYYAIQDTCTHAGASLSEGSLEGSVITCGWHGAKFDCKTGKLSSFPVKIKDLNSYKVVIESENIFVEV